VTFLQVRSTILSVDSLLTGATFQSSAAMLVGHPVMRVRVVQAWWGEDDRPG